MWKVTSGRLVAMSRSRAGWVILQRTAVEREPVKRWAVGRIGQRERRGERLRAVRRVEPHATPFGEALRCAAPFRRFAAVCAAEIIVRDPESACVGAREPLAGETFDESLRASHEA